MSLTTLGYDAANFVVCANSDHDRDASKLGNIAIPAGEMEVRAGRPEYLGGRLSRCLHEVASSG